MSKPDWKDAPEWANYLAMDSDGLWAWHEKKPFVAGFATVWLSRDYGQVAIAYKPHNTWHETLEERPHA
jgi:hypothetical protein